jgi:hypothetical protein
VDPITAILQGNWATASGWGLWIGTVVVIVTGSFREWWAPGARLKRTEALLEKALTAITALNEQNGKLVTGNEITKHWFETYAPKKGAITVDGDEGSSSA